MIYTLTLNPALDYIMHIPDYSEGRVNRSASEQIFAGGKGINVSIVLKSLGVSSTALGFTAGSTGDMFESLLAAQDISCDFIRLKTGATRINVKLKHGKETEINAAGPVPDKAATDALFAKLDNLKDGDMLVLAGSAPNHIYRDIAKFLQNRKIDITVDATGELLRSTLKYKPFLIKPNNFELEEIFSKKLKNIDEIELCAKQLQKEGARNVLVSLGADGAILVADDGKTYHRTAPKGNVINTTGSGDSTVAGFLAGYLKDGNFAEALKLGVCAGSASAFAENLATYDEIMKLYNEK